MGNGWQRKDAGPWKLWRLYYLPRGAEKLYILLCNFFVRLLSRCPRASFSTSPFVVAELVVYVVRPPVPAHGEKEGHEEVPQDHLRNAVLPVAAVGDVDPL